MKKNSNIFLILVLALIAGSEAALLNLSLKQRQILKAQISETSKEREYFKEQLNMAGQLIGFLKESLEAKKEEVLKEQVKVKNLKEELIKAKEDIDGITQELNLIKDLKVETENRLQLTLKKFEDLKRPKLLPLRERIVELTKSLNKKNKDILELKKKLNESEKTYSVLAENNKSLAEGIKGLESVRLKLSGELQDARNQLLKQTEIINEQSRNLQELNMANQEFKKQITQLSEVLIRRELELTSREKEVETFKGKVSELAAKRADLESQLSTTQNEQKKAISLLTEVASINAALEEKLAQFSPTSSKKDEKEITEELKRKVEVILNSKNP